VIFWLPAVLVAYFFNNSIVLSHILQWFTAFFMLFGWAVNTGIAAYHEPRTTLAVLMTYAGAHLLLILFLYNQDNGSGLGAVLRQFGGILSFIPLDIFVKALRQYSPAIPHELYVTGFLAACCLVGYLAGIMRRRIHPNPYRPVIKR
jgi:hypothetical protein